MKNVAPVWEQNEKKFTDRRLKKWIMKKSQIDDYVAHMTVELKQDNFYAVWNENFLECSFGGNA